MGQVLSLPLQLWHTTRAYYAGFFHYWCGAGRHTPYNRTALESTFRPLHPPSPAPPPSPTAPRRTSRTDDGGPDAAAAAAAGAEEEEETRRRRLFQQHARIHLYALSSNFYLYQKPHYRKGSYRDDLVDNLRNVAIPGTGMPLSLMASNRFVALTFLWTAYPAVSLVAALHKWFQSNCQSLSIISQEYATRLLAPDDWFSYWRLNCIVVGLHAALHDTPVDYDMENKWTFLQEGEARNVPISPFLKTPALVVKHRNEEGGLGIYFYKNATEGGDWILQERLHNAAWVQNLLPPHAPLSTFRVITCSKASLDLNRPPSASDVTALSCVFRAGRAGASTDHDSILYDVDVNTGTIRGGTTNAHWYRLGLRQALPGHCPWRSSHNYTTHPDPPHPSVTGHTIPNMAQMLALVERSHLVMCPRVPLAGWDVVFSDDDPNLPICLLEVNLSCNFFRGSFDQTVYLDFVEESLVRLQALRLEADRQRKTFKVKVP